MDAEVAVLVTAGATALVEAMVGDGWTAARTRVAAFFGRRRDGDEDAAGGELDVTREELLAARDTGDADAEADVLAAWRGRMRRALRADPEAAAELRLLLAELGHEEGEGRGGGVAYNTISGGVQHGDVVQAHTVNRK
ncbi:hypothetical protein RB200_17075 [Streptomyces sp. PmtG]